MKRHLRSGAALSLAAIGQMVISGCAPLGRAPAAAAASTAAIAKASVAPAPMSGNPERCAALSGQTIGGATVTSVAYVETGQPISPFNVPSRATFCQVLLTIEPVAKSSIDMVVWLPTTWNSKIIAEGGGGFDGGLHGAVLTLSGPAAKGYAAIATNAGHDASGRADWAAGQPERIVDWGYRANHLASVVGKAVSQEYYAAPAVNAFFHGCSTGGRDALMMAQRYPDDYDAIVVGAPATRYTAIMAAFASYSQTVGPTPDLSTKFPALRERVLARCDEDDGVKDGLISRPTECRFDPAEMACDSQVSAECLTAEEVAAVRTLYRGVYTPDGRQIMAGLTPGSEYEWKAWVTATTALSASMATDFYRNFVYEDKEWSLNGFQILRDYPAGQSRIGAVIDADETDLRPFLSKGGKLLFYQGWDDAAIPPGETIEYFEQAQANSGPAARDGLRLFMLPGVAHCNGGKGPDSVDYLGAIDAWHSTNTAPERLIASKLDNPVARLTGQPANVIRTRPLCAWPRHAEYDGSGSTDEEENFVCR
ncbi:tannase/feruloyl esterase family alpha/beta hydrolase [Brevundimonas intermedia]|uniref:tannase/feruloyl esterase family alpha/beta hydrolase n=1 Tax=Brevundimonas intermedia TaxID=74315 RepID=UPI00320917F1